MSTTVVCVWNAHGYGPMNLASSVGLVYFGQLAYSIPAALSRGMHMQLLLLLHVHDGPWACKPSKPGLKGRFKFVGMPS